MRIAPPPMRENQFEKIKARPPTSKKKTFAPGYLVKHFAKCILHRYEIGARLQAEFGGGNSPPELCSQSFAGRVRAGGIPAEASSGT